MISSGNNISWEIVTAIQVLMSQSGIDTSHTHFEIIEGIVELVDSELSGDPEYDSMGPNSVGRVKALLGKLDGVRRSERGGYKVADAARTTSHKFMGSVQDIFTNLPKPLEWRSFYNNDLNLLVASTPEIRDVAIRRKLNRSQIRALGKLNAVSESVLQGIVDA